MINSYRVHNFLNVEIEEGTLPLHVNYEHYFSQMKVNSRSASVDYSIKEFSTFELPRTHFRNGDYNLGFDGGVCFPFERYAVTYDGHCLTEYTDAANRATNMWLQFLLLAQGKSLVHSAGIEIAGRNYIFPAFGGAGKSLLVGALRHRSDFKLFGDDFVIVDDSSTMHAYLTDISMYHYHLKFFPELTGSPYHQYLERYNTAERFYSSCPGGKVLRRVASIATRRARKKRIFPGVNWNLDYVKVPVSCVIPPSHLGKSAPLDAAIYLSRTTDTDFRIERISAEDLVNRIRSVLAVEFRYSSAYLSFMGAFGCCNPSALSRREEEILTKCFDGLDCYHVIVPQSLPAREYVERMTGFLESMGC